MLTPKQSLICDSTPSQLSIPSAGRGGVRESQDRLLMNINTTTYFSYATHTMRHDMHLHAGSYACILSRRALRSEKVGMCFSSSKCMQRVSASSSCNKRTQKNHTQTECVSEQSLRGKSDSYLRDESSSAYLKIN